MHTLGKFIQELMDDRGMTRPELVTASGLSRQHVQQLLTRDSLGRMPEPSTFTRLAAAFPGIPEETFIWRAAEAIGVPVDRLTVVTPRMSDLATSAVFNELGQRLGLRSRLTSPTTEVGAELKISSSAEGRNELHEAPATGGESLQEMIRRVMREEGLDSVRALYRRLPDNKDRVTYETVRKLANGEQRGTRDPRVFRDLAIMLRVDENDVRTALNELPTYGDWELPPRAQSLNPDERATVMNVVDAILRAKGAVEPAVSDRTVNLADGHAANDELAEHFDDADWPAKADEYRRGHAAADELADRRRAPKPVPADIATTAADAQDEPTVRQASKDLRNQDRAGQENQDPS